MANTICQLRGWGQDVEWVQNGGQVLIWNGWANYYTKFQDSTFKNEQIMAF